MTRPIDAATLTACLLLAPAPLLAQTTNSDVTFKVPLNLTNVAADIGKVRVLCVITSDALTTAIGPIPPLSSVPANNASANQQEWPVTSGQVATTATVVVPVPATGLVADAVGKTANYACFLGGFSTSLQRWDVFDAAHTVPEFRLTPSPPLLQGSFTW